MIYVAMKYGQDCCSWHQELVASHDKEKIENYVAEQTALNSRRKHIREKGHLHDKNFSMHNTVPVYETPDNRKKWPAGMAEKDITGVMRAEREATDAKNRAIHERNGEKMNVWYREMEASRLTYLAGLGITAEEFEETNSGGYDSYDVTFGVEELEEI